MEELAAFNNNLKDYRLTVNFEILRKYHPVAQIEFEVLKSNNQNFYTDLPFAICFKNLNLESTCENFARLNESIQNLESRKKSGLTSTSIGNMIYLISLHKKLDNPNYHNVEDVYAEEFRKILSMLISIERNLPDQSNLYFQIVTRGINIANNDKHIEIREDEFIEDVLVMLKNRYISKLISLKESYSIENQEEFFAPMESYMEITLSVLLNKPIERPYSVSLEHAERFLRRHKRIKRNKNYVHNIEFLRRLYKTLSTYLDGEIKTDKPNYSENCRIIHMLCSSCGIIEFNPNKRKQHESVHDILKNFSTDERFKLVPNNLFEMIRRKAERKRAKS